MSDQSEDSSHHQLYHEAMSRSINLSNRHEEITIELFLAPAVLHDWCNKGRGMCYPACGMVHIKEPLLLIDNSSLCP